MRGIYPYYYEIVYEYKYGVENTYLYVCNIEINKIEPTVQIVQGLNNN